MSGEFNPYTPPQAEAAPRRMEVPEGRLWKIEEGRLLVRDRASLPDVCVLGTIGEEGARTSKAFRAAPWWTKLFPVLPVLSLFFADILPRGSFIVAVAITVLLPMAVGKKLRVMVFQSRRKEQVLRNKRGAIVVASIVAVVAISKFLMKAGFFPQSSGEVLAVAMIIGLGPVLDFLPLQIPYGAVRAADGWFELKGVPAPVIVRLTEIQQRVVHAP